MSFYLVEVGRDGQEFPLQGYPHIEKGTKAGLMAKRLTEKYGSKIQPRRLADAPDWRPVQEKRSKDGTYAVFPEGWDLAPIKDHFAHPYVDLWSGDSKVQIRFIANEQDGLFDKPTALNPGRYLQKFYPGLSDAEKRRLIALIDPPAQVLFASTDDEIREVYLNGPTSCMSYETRDEWATLHCHPVEAYAAGDLQIAYIKNRSGTISARSVCWPEKKLYGRLYGDQARLEQALQDLGYTQTKTFIGARIAKIPHRTKRRKESEQRYIMPYFDNILALVEQGDVFVSIDPDPVKHPWAIIDGGTSGLSRRGRYCPCLKDYIDGPFFFVHGPNEEWSHRAVSENTFRCYATDEIWPIEHRVFVEDQGAWSIKHFKENGFTCAISGENYSNALKLVLEDGRTVARHIWEREQREEQRRKQREEQAKASNTQKMDAWGYIISDTEVEYAPSGPHLSFIEPRVTMSYDMDRIAREFFGAIGGNSLHDTVREEERPEPRHPRHVDRPAWADQSAAEIRSAASGNLSPTRTIRRGQRP